MDNRALFFGRWKLVSYDIGLFHKGTLRMPLRIYGEKAIGTLSYTQGNYMSVQIMKSDRLPFFVTFPPVLTGEPLKMTPQIIKYTRGGVEDVVNAFRGYIAYFGTYEVTKSEGTSGTIIHTLEGALSPNFCIPGLNQETRSFEFEERGNSLTLGLDDDIDGGGQNYLKGELLWERVE